MNQLQSRYEDRYEVKKFRHAYVLKPGPFDFSKLKECCDRIVYATDGYSDQVESLRQQLEESMAGFDANKDVVVPSGSSVVSLMAGAIMQRKMNENSTWDSYAMGVFVDGSYHFWRVHVDPTMESYEIIQR